MYYDTHVHFDIENENEIPGIVERAIAADVKKMIAVGGTRDMNHMATKVAEAFPVNVRAAVGWDRSNIGKLGASAVNLETHVITDGVVAIGETGLDFHYDGDNRDAQKALFQEHLGLAQKLELPVIVHCRDAEDEIGYMLEEHAKAWSGDKERMGVIHCFTGDSLFAERIVSAGFYISFSGIVTFRNADSLRAAAQVVPPEKILIETDTPYLAPVPHRGKQNEPAYVVRVAAMLAEVRGCSIESIADTTSSNAERLFGF